MNPYRPLSENDMLAQLDLAKSHAEQGMYSDAEEISKGIRERYGLLGNHEEHPCQ